MAHMQIRQRYYEMLRKKYGTHTAVAKRLGITQNYYRRIRNQPDYFHPSVALRNLIVTLVSRIKLEDELLKR